MTIILDDKASREIRVALRDIVPHGRSIRLPAELNTILVVIVVRLERGPILVDERLPRDPTPSSARFNRARRLNAAKPRPEPVVPHGRDLSGYIEYERVFQRRGER